MSTEDEMIEKLRQLLEKAAEEKAMRGPPGEWGKDAPDYVVTPEEKRNRELAMKELRREWLASEGEGGYRP